MKDMKNLSTKMNSTCLITPQTKFQALSMKGERKYSFLVSSCSIVKYETLVQSFLNTPITIVLNH